MSLSLSCMPLARSSNGELEETFTHLGQSGSTYIPVTSGPAHSLSPFPDLSHMHILLSWLVIAIFECAASCEKEKSRGQES